MKALSVAVLVVLLSVCIQSSDAVPFAEAEVQETEAEHSPAEVQMNFADEEVQSLTEGKLRTKRQSHLSLCRYCCNCCHNKGCGFCCRF
ncbi:hepcidin-1 [Lepisosteus oculatus]|uniref:hepcidin-1 n=1 Tax=Lepisosteus oculatus TaxID=7918 RepID=UPI0037236220